MLTFMSDSLLVEALDDTRALLDDLEDDADAEALRERVEVLTRASLAIELRPALRDHIVRLARLAIEVRDHAMALRQRHRSVQRLVQGMMD